MLSGRTPLLEGLEVSLRFFRGQSGERFRLDRARVSTLCLLAVGDPVTICVHSIGIGLFRIQSAVAVQVFGPVRQTIVVTVGIIGVRAILGALFELVGQTILVSVFGIFSLLVLLPFLLPLPALLALRLSFLLFLTRILPIALLLVLLLLTLLLLLLLSFLGLLVSTPYLIANELEIELGVLIVRVDLQSGLVELDGFLQPPLSKGRIPHVVERLSSDARILRQGRPREGSIGLLEVAHLIVDAADVESYLRIVGALDLQVDEALQSVFEEPRLVGRVGATRTSLPLSLASFGS